MLHNATSFISGNPYVVAGMLVGCLVCASAATARAAEEEATPTVPGDWRHLGDVLSVAWHPNGRWIASGGEDGMTRVWDVETGSERLSLAAHPNSVSRVAFSPDGKLLASISWSQRRGVKFRDAEPGYALRFWHAESGRRVSQIPIIDERPAAQRVGLSSWGAWDFAFSPDGTQVATIGHQMSTLRPLDIVKLWDVSEGTLLSTFSKPPDLPRGGRSVVFSPDGKHLVTAGLYFHDATKLVNRDVRQTWPLPMLCALRVWDVRRGTHVEKEISFEGRLRELMTDITIQLSAFGGQLAFHPDGELLALGLHSGEVRLLQFPSLELSQEVSLPNQSKALAIAFAHDGRLLATNGPDSLIWTERDGAETFRLEGATSSVYSAAFSPDGTRLATGHGNAEVAVWNAATGERIK